MIFAKIAAFFAGGILRWLTIAGGGIAIILAAYGGGYLHGQVNSKNAAEVRQLEATVEHLQAEIARRDARTEADNAAREADRAELERLDETIRELSDELQNRDGCGLSDDTAERLRRGWGR